MPTAPSLERTRQMKLSPRRSISSVSIMTGDENNSRLSTGCLSTSSSFAYFGLARPVGAAAAAVAVGGAAQPVRAAPAPLASVPARNPRRLVFMAPLYTRPASFGGQHAGTAGSLIKDGLLHD